MKNQTIGEQTFENIKKLIAHMVSKGEGPSIRTAPVHPDLIAKLKIASHVITVTDAIRITCLGHISYDKIGIENSDEQLLYIGYGKEGDEEHIFICKTLPAREKPLIQLRVFETPYDVSPELSFKYDWRGQKRLWVRTYGSMRTNFIEGENFTLLGLYPMVFRAFLYAVSIPPPPSGDTTTEHEQKEPKTDSAWTGMVILQEIVKKIKSIRMPRITREQAWDFLLKFVGVR